MPTFEELGLNNEILNTLKEIGFENPTPVQTKSIPHLLSSRQDLISLAQTGTGKTAAFSLPIIQQVVAEEKKVQALILCPTRELCMQITKDLEKFLKYFPAVRVTAVFGGARMDSQIRALHSGTQIVVGTPGRVLDMIGRRKLLVGDIRWLVIDEADEILDMGFKEDLDAILAGTPENKQTLLFSATMAPPVRKIAQKYMKNPVEFSVDKETRGADNVEHKYYLAHAKDRYKVLRRIADINPEIYGIIFCRTKIETQEIADLLIQDHYSAEAIHGDLSQEQRNLVMTRFRNRQTQLLVATDVAARGIDVKNLSHIINYQLPDSLDTYLHRSGRTGRAGNFGISLSIINMKEISKIQAMERRVGKKFIREAIPLGKDICERQLFHLIEKIKQSDVDEKQIAPFLSAIEKQLEGISRDQLIKQFVSLEFTRFLAFYQEAPDLNASVSGNTTPQRTFREKNPNIIMKTVCLRSGKRDGINIKSLFNMINSQRTLREAEIGHIEIGQNETFIEIDENYEQELFNFLKNKTENRSYSQPHSKLSPKSNFRPKSSFRPRNSGHGFAKSGRRFEKRRSRG